MDDNLTIFDLMYPKYKTKKTIRLIEFFAGYGSQALALKYLGVKFEHWKICEWAVKSIQAYKDIHFPDKDVEFKEERTKEEMVEFLYRKGISSNYNEPMSKEQIKRLKEEDLKKIIKNIGITHNLVNIQQVKGEDLEIKDTDKYDYILTYSFPCQDLSLAGKQKGMSDTSTRSGMLWEVERILSECKELGNMPKILLMENVPQVHGTDNLQDFNKWQLRLEELGYKNYMQDLIATDYGIPQTRNRCFMISILGDYSYTFPKPISLKLKLKDMLEENVDEKYFLSDKMINYIIASNEKWTGNNEKAIINKTLASTINTNEGSRRCDASNYISKELEENYNLKKELCNNLIKNNLVRENDVIRHSYTKSRMNGDMKDLKQNNLSPTLDTRCDCLGIAVSEDNKNRFLTDKDGYEIAEPKIIDDRDANLNGVNITNICPTQRATRNGLKVLQTDLRIRKLTPKECFRLMGVKDEDFEKARKNQSDSSLYHLAGDSIVVNVLMAIFKELL